jgi:diguanylate cyclase (GGDEF)-like protein/PAS domain S-box-containing protein
MSLSDGGGKVAVFQDITERLEEEKELRLAGAVFASSQQGIVVTDDKGSIIQVNPAFCHITGYEEHELIGQNPRILKSGLQDSKFYSKMWRSLKQNGSWNGELYNRRKNGEHYVQWANIDAIKTEHGELLYVGISSDITELVDARERLSKLAYYDTLTHLPNRVLFQDRISQTIAQAKRDNTGFSLILADLDDFKAVNDTMGHAVGDKLLMKVAERLRHTTRESDTVARLGGDEFAMVLMHIDDPQQVATIASHILETLSQTYKINGLEITSSVSLGVTFWPIDGENIDELLKNADVAMYRAKEYGRNNFQFFTSDMADNVVNALRIENGLRNALDSGELSLYYQPQIDLQGNVVSAEALMRWDSKELGWVPPSQFIPVAERSGLIVPIEAFALREACRQCAKWRDSLSPGFRIAVNISAAQFRHEGLINSVAGALHEFNLPGSALELEITESVVMDDVVRGRAVIHQLKKTGCSLAIDDFGTGYSSLAYLNQFKVDVLKIDKSFIDGLGVESDDTSVAEAIVSLAKSLDLTVVAEGVETSLQLEAIKKITDSSDCLTQGYFFSPPVPADVFELKYPKFNQLRIVGED